MSTNTSNLIFKWDEVAKALFLARGIKSGLWRIGVGLKYAAANTGPSDAEMMPTGLVAVESLLLVPAESPAPLVFDAAASVAGKARPKARKAARAPTVRRRVE